MTKEERQQMLKRLEREAIDDEWNFLQEVGEGLKHSEGIRTNEQWPVIGSDTDE